MGNRDDLLSEEFLEVVDIISLNESQIDKFISKSMAAFFGFSIEAKIFELIKRFPKINVLCKMGSKGAIYSERVKSDNYENEFMDLAMD